MLGQLAGQPFDETALEGDCCLAAAPPGRIVAGKSVAWIGCPNPIDPSVSLDQLSGPFAFAAVHEDGLLLGRGRMGGHPLYYGRDHDGRVMACSRLEPLIHLLQKEHDLDVARLAELILLVPGGSVTPYRGIRRLLSGELIFFGRHEERHRRLPPFATQTWTGGDVRVAAEQLLHLIDRAVARAVGSAKNVAVSVGGLDSSGLLATLVARARGAPAAEVKAITLHFADPGDDRPYVRDLCRALGIEPIRLKPAQCARFLLNPVSLDAIPLTFATVPSTLEICLRAKEQGSEVLLTGEGGDLVFDGDLGLFADQFLQGHPIRALRDAARLRGVPYLGRRLGRLSGLVLRPVVKRLVPGLHRSWRRARSRRFVERDLAWAGPCLRSLLRDRLETDPPVDDIAMGELILNMSDVSNNCSDYTECRTAHPYLDEDLVGFVGSLPRELLFHGGYKRGLFRLAFQKLLPESVRLRENKSGFGPAAAEIFVAAGGAKLIAPYTPMRRLSDLGLVEPEAFKTAAEHLVRDPSEPAQWVKIWPAIAIEAFLASRSSGDASFDRA
jgi:asparagine synthetase B (glutamine-hydrolysing)